MIHPQSSQGLSEAWWRRCQISFRAMQNCNITHQQWRTLKRHEHVTFLYASVERPPKDKGM